MSVSIQDKSASNDWFVTFPEALYGNILPRIRKLESEIPKLESVVLKELRRAERLKDGWFVRECIKVFKINDLIQSKQELNRLRRYIPQKHTRGQVTQEQIERAKEYPIVQLAETQLQNMKKCGSTYRSLCPYHDERSPSFYLYPRGNNFHCFGCSEHGDVIALTQKLQGLNFVEAVKFLTASYGA